MPDRIFELFDEYAAAYARGEQPAAEEYLARAGEDADELAGLLEGVVASVPVPAAAAAEVTAFAVWVEGRSPLRRLRTERGATLEHVVENLIERLGLDHAKREKVKRYYRELEAGLLDASRVSRRVWDALAVIVGPLGALPPPPQAEQMVARPAAVRQYKIAYTAPPAAAARAAPREPTSEPPTDEIDRLFRGTG